jgi:septal ring factor EnvC (AmiA/AmiB activator)
MAISLITALKLVPWTEVVSNAPLVVDGAKKLWKAVGKKTAPVKEGGAEVEHELSPDEETIAALASRISSLETDVADLQRKMVSSAELIKALADQNAQLVRAVEVLRRRLLGVIAILGVVAMACLYLLLGR